MDTIEEMKVLNNHILNFSDDNTYSATLSLSHRYYCPVVVVSFTRNDKMWLDIVIMKNGYERRINTNFYKSQVIDTMLYSDIYKILGNGIKELIKVIMKNSENTIESKSNRYLSSSIDECLRYWAEFDKEHKELENERYTMNSYIMETWKSHDNYAGGESFVKYINDYKIELQLFNSAKVGIVTIRDKEFDLYRAFSIGFKEGHRDEVNTVLWFFERFMFQYVIYPSQENQDILNKVFNKLPYKTDIICMDNDIRKGDFRWKE